MAERKAFLLRLDPRPDIVLATGDLVDGGKPEEYDRLRRLLAPLPLLTPAERGPAFQVFQVVDVHVNCQKRRGCHNCQK